MSDAETIKLKEVEIERLRKVVEAQVERLDYLEARHVNEFNLLIRAADALEEDHELIKDFFSKASVRDKFLGLIDELRKAAQ